MASLRFLPILFLLLIPVFSWATMGLRIPQGGGLVGRGGSRNRAECPCDEIYVVEEGETLQTISVKCRAPFILADNPQIQDTDDIFPGVVLMMQCDESGEMIMF